MAAAEVDSINDYMESTEFCEIFTVNNFDVSLNRDTSLNISLASQTSQKGEKKDV